MDFDCDVNCEPIDYIAEYDFERENPLLVLANLERVIDWIQKHLQPNNVFSGNVLKKWVQETYTADGVYPESELAEWAENNGFVKSELNPEKETE